MLQPAHQRSALRLAPDAGRDGRAPAVHPQQELGPGQQHSVVPPVGGEVSAERHTSARAPVGPPVRRHARGRTVLDRRRGRWVRQVAARHGGHPLLQGLATHGRHSDATDRPGQDQQAQRESNPPGRGATHRPGNGDCARARPEPVEGAPVHRAGLTCDRDCGPWREARDPGGCPAGGVGEAGTRSGPAKITRHGSPPEETTRMRLWALALTITSVTSIVKIGRAHV